MTAATVLIGGGLALLAAPAAQAAGTTRYVDAANPNATDSDNDCTDPSRPCKTIQYAVGLAADGETVQVAAGTYAEAVTIRTSITLLGAGSTGSGKTTISGPADGTSASIDVNGVDLATQLSVTIKDVDVSGNTGNAGIYDEDANLAISDSAVSNNRQQGIRLDGPDTPKVTIDTVTVSGDGQQGIMLDSESNPDVAVTNSSIDSNGMSGGEGQDYSGIEAYGGTLAVSGSTLDKNGFGGIYLQSVNGTNTISDSTLDSNGANALELAASTVTVTRSTLSNSAPTGESGDQLGAGIIAYNGSSVAVQTSTISGNTTWGVLLEGVPGTVANSTISGTKAAPAGVELPAPAAALAFAAEQQIPEIATQVRTAVAAPEQIKPRITAQAAPTLAVQATITAQNAVPDCSGTVDDGGYNLDSDGTCGFTATQHSVSKGDAKLGSLADNGGPTLTQLPAKGSDAIDAISSGSANCTSQGTDQRGDPRLAGPKCDIGAVEVAQPPVVIKPDALPDGTVGASYRMMLTATGGLGAPYVWSLAAGSSLPPGLTLTSGGVLSGTPSAAGTFTFTVSVDDPTTKTDTLVIVAPASSSSAPLAATGAQVGSTTGWGVGLLAVGLLFVFAGLTRRRTGRHQA